MLSGERRGGMAIGKTSSTILTDGPPSPKGKAFGFLHLPIAFPAGGEGGPPPQAVVDEVENTKPFPSNRPFRFS